MTHAFSGVVSTMLRRTENKHELGPVTFSSDRSEIRTVFRKDKL